MQAFAWLRSDADLRDVTRLALPAIANSLLQTLLFVVDRLILGHHSESALAAMQTAGPVIWSVFSVFGAFTVGTVALVGRAIGARDPVAASSAARGSFALALIIGSAVGVIGSIALEPMLAVFGAGGGPDVHRAAVGYLEVALPGMPLFFLGLTSISILQAAGDTRTPLAIGIATNVINIVGNWVLVFGHFGAPRLGAMGSAGGSVCAAIAETLLGAWALARVGSPVLLRARPGVSALAGARRVLRVAWASWGEKIVYHAGYLAYVAFVIRLGETAMAANQALISVESIAFLTADGCAIAAASLVAQRLGAQEPARAKAAGWRAAGLCAAILAACGTAFALFPAPLVRAFRDDPGIVAMGSNALRVAAVAQIPMAIGVVLGQAMRGAGATREALAVSFLGALVVRLGATWFFVAVMHFGLVGVWMGSTTDWIVRALVYAWRWRSGAWARTRV